MKKIKNLQSGTKLFLVFSSILLLLSSCGGQDQDLKGFWVDTQDKGAANPIGRPFFELKEHGVVNFQKGSSGMKKTILNWEDEYRIEEDARYEVSKGSLGQDDGSTDRNILTIVYKANEGYGKFRNDLTDKYPFYFTFSGDGSLILEDRGPNGYSEGYGTYTLSRYVSRDAFFEEKKNSKE